MLAPVASVALALLSPGGLPGLFAGMDGMTVVWLLCAGRERGRVVLVTLHAVDTQHRFVEARAFHTRIEFALLALARRDQQRRAQHDTCLKAARRHADRNNGSPEHSTGGGADGSSTTQQEIVPASV